VIVLKGHRHRVERVAFSPDGTAVFAPTWQGIQVWRPFLAEGTPTVLPIQHARALHFTPDGRSLFVVGYGLHRANLATGAVTKLADSSTARFALARGGDRYVADRSHIGGQGPVMVACSAAGAELWARPAYGWWGQPLFLPGDDEFIRVDIEGEYRRDYQFRIVVAVTATGDDIRQTDPLADEVRHWILSPDAACVACLTTVWVRVYPLRERFTEPLATLRNDNRKEFTDIAFHPSGKYLAATSNDATVKLYDTTTWDVARTFTWDIGKMRSVAFSPDGTLAAAGSDKGKVVVWDVDL
jgi:WD40 repeat protein